MAIEAVKPSMLLEVIPIVTLFCKKSPTLPLAQVLGVVTDTDNTSWTLSWKVRSLELPAETGDQLAEVKKNRAPTSIHTGKALKIFLDMFLL